MTSHQRKHGGGDAPMDRPVGGGRRFARKTARWAGVTGLAGLVVAGAAYLAAQQGADLAVSRDRLTIATAREGAVADAVAFAGRAQPMGLIRLDAIEGGRVARLHVRPGETVVRGQKIVSLENAERSLAFGTRISQIQSDLGALAAQRSQLRQSRLADRKSVLQARFDLQRARGVLARREILLGKGIIGEAHVAPQREEVAFYEAILKEAEAIEAQNDAASAEQAAAIEAQARLLNDNLAAAQRQLEAFTVTAPADGVVMGLQATLGAAIDAGAPIAEIDPRQGLVIEATLDEFYASRVGPGVKAYAEIGGVAHELTLTQASPDIRDGSFRVELAFAQAQPDGLRAGESVQGRLLLEEAGPAVTIPNGPFMARSNGRYVFVLSADGDAALRREVRAGARTPENVAILDGLSVGEQVIVSEYDSFADAATIRLR